MGFRLCGLDVVGHFLATGAPIRRHAVLTFDDGFADLYDHLLPLVLQRHVPAVVYLVSDRERADWCDWGPMGAPWLLSRRQALEMAEAGVTIGSHGRTHADLTRLTPRRLVGEVEGSRKVLEDRLGHEVRHFCYPYGAHDERVVRAVERAGYATACTVERGFARTGCSLLRLPRVPVSASTRRLGLLKRTLRGR